MEKRYEHLKMEEGERIKLEDALRELNV